MIRVQDLTRSYGDLKAVDAVSFEVGPGEIVGLLGHNGAGKTTIMRMLSGYLEPDEGTIVIDTDAARLEKLTGTLGANPDANCGFNLETDGGDRSIGYDASTRAYVVSDSGSDQVSVDALPDGAVTDVYGEEAINGCFDAETIIAFQ